MLQAKLVCTIGPACKDELILRALISAGMNVARLNMSHGTHEEHRKNIELIRSISFELNKPVAILVDLQGPKLRLGKMQASGVIAKKGEILVLTNEEATGVLGCVPIQNKELPQMVKPNERIFIDDGLIELLVLDVDNGAIRTKVVTGGHIRDNKGMNFPDTDLTIPALTDKDIADLEFAIEEKADWIALSFVRTADEVIDLKCRIQSRLSDIGHVIPVISKIEKPEAITNILAIIEASDAIMVARGDLGVEVDFEDVPGIQKMLIRECHRANKPVIVATQMLHTMINSPRPTRAEANDVANAIEDGASAVMLSGETANGEYPVEAAQAMSRIVQKTEAEMRVDLTQKRYNVPTLVTISDSIGLAVSQTAETVGAKAIIVPTFTGATAKTIASFHPSVPIVSVVPNPAAYRQLSLYKGVIPVLSDNANSVNEVLINAIAEAKNAGYIVPGDVIVLTAGVVDDIRGATNSMFVHTVKEKYRQSGSIHLDMTVNAVAKHRRPILETPDLTRCNSNHPTPSVFAVN